MKSKFFNYYGSLLNMDLIALINGDLKENNVEVFLKNGFKINMAVDNIKDFFKNLYKYIKENEND